MLDATQLGLIGTKLKKQIDQQQYKSIYNEETNWIRNMKRWIIETSWDAAQIFSKSLPAILIGRVLSQANN